LTAAAMFGLTWKEFDMTIAKDQDIAGDSDVKNTDDGWSKGYSCAGRELKS